MWLTKQKADIAFLQETYSSIEDEKFWNTQWKGKMLFSHGSHHSKGTLVLLGIFIRCLTYSPRISNPGTSSPKRAKELKSKAIPHTPPFDPQDYNLVLNSVKVSLSEMDTKTFYEAHMSDLRETPQHS